jgi:RNA polymerase sigma-70 factor (sigma-E family)
MSNSSLVARVVETREPLEVAFEKHYLPTLRLIVLLSGNPHTAEDVVQEAFVRVADRIASLTLDQAGRYIRRAAINTWKNQLRRLALERRLRGRDYWTSPGQEWPFEDRDALWEAVLRLPNRQRACLVLRYYEDLPERAVAEILHCSVGTVKGHTARALASLRKELNDDHRR